MDQELQEQVAALNAAESRYHNSDYDSVAEMEQQEDELLAAVHAFRDYVTTRWGGVQS